MPKTTKKTDRKDDTERVWNYLLGHALSMDEIKKCVRDGKLPKSVCSSENCVEFTEGKYPRDTLVLLIILQGSGDCMQTLKEKL